MESNNREVSTVVVIVALVLSGCGSGGSGVENEFVPPESVQPVSSPGDEGFLSGRFLDSAVKGLAYSTATQQGFTNGEGAFRYQDGETVTFYIGDPTVSENRAWMIGETTAREIITPLELLGTDTVNQQVRNILRLLQSIDVDGDSSNGIELPDHSTHLPDGNLMLDLSLSDLEFEIDPALQSYIESIGASGELISAQHAVDHFQTTLNELLDFPLGVWNFTHGTIDGLAISDLSASIHFESETHYSAQFSLPDNSGAIRAQFTIDGRSFLSDVESFQLNLDGQSTSHQSDDVVLMDNLQLLPEPTQGLVDVLLGIGAKLCVLPNSVVLESEDGRIVLNYSRSDSAGGDGVIAYLQIDSPGDALSTVGEVVQLDATAYSPSSATVTPVQFSWSSSDSTIATVNSDGLVTAVSSGSVTINVSAAGFNASVDVEVSIPTVELPVNQEIVSVEEDSVVTVEEDPFEVDQSAVDNEESESNEPVECAEGQVATQSNERTVTQENVSVDNLTPVQQSNEQTVVQNNSGVTCVPIVTIETDLPGFGI